MATSESHVHYDTDDVSVTSTVLSEGKAVYEAESVLSVTTRPGPNGTDETVYLVKWFDYPLSE